MITLKVDKGLNKGRDSRLGDEVGLLIVRSEVRMCVAISEINLFGICETH